MSVEQWSKEAVEQMFDAAKEAQSEQAAAS